MWLSRYKTTYLNILKLGLPLIVGQIGLIVTAFADTVMVGHYSTEALASASFVNNLFNTPMMAIMGFTYGMTPLVGALFGQGRSSDIGRLVKAGLVVTGVFALIVTGLMWWIYDHLEILDPPAELMPTIRPYYLLYLAGLVPVALCGVFLQWSYAIRNTVLPTVVLLAANGLNIIGNYVLIFGHLGFDEMGLTGAGISTLIVRFLPLLAMAAVFFFKGSYTVYREGFTTSKMHSADVRRVTGTSWPVSLQLTLESGSFTLAAVMAGWLGKIPLASFQVIVVVGMLGFCIYYSIGNATSILVANNAGLDDVKTMRRDAWGGYHIMLVFTVAASFLFFFAGKQLMGLFTEDPEVLAASTALIFPLILYQMGDATQITFSNALRGTSRVMPMLWIAFVAYVVIGVPAMYLLGITAGMGVYGIILSFSVSLFTAGGLFLYYFLDTLKHKS